MREAQDVVLCGNPETNTKNLTLTFIKWKQQKNESNINHKRSHMFFIGSYGEQNSVTYALRVDRRKCHYLTPKEHSYSSVTSIQTQRGPRKSSPGL
jgi:hypothetical protein